MISLDVVGHRCNYRCMSDDDVDVDDGYGTHFSMISMIYAGCCCCYCCCLRLFFFINEIHRLLRYQIFFILNFQGFEV